MGVAERGSKTHAMRYIKAVLAVAAWGASFVATKIALRDFTPIALVWARFTIGVLILGIIVLARGQLRPISRSEFAYFLLLGFLGITFHQWLQSNALRTSQATTAGWIIATIPLFIAVLGRLFLRERLGWPGVVGILIACFGVLLVIAKGNLRAIAIEWEGTPGDKLMVISAVNWAVFSVLSRRGLKRNQPAFQMFYVMLLGWLLTTALFAAGGFHGIGHLSGPGIGALLFLGIACSGLAFIFWYDALEQLDASHLGVFHYLGPLFTVVTAAVVLHERISPGTMAGGAIILLGVWLVNRERE